MNTIKSKLSENLKIAMKARNDAAIKAIRSLMAAIDNAGAVPVESSREMPMSGGIAGASDGLGSTDVPRKELSNEEIRNIIRREIDEIDMAIRHINDPSKTEVVLLTKQAAVLREFL